MRSEIKLIILLFMIFSLVLVMVGCVNENPTDIHTPGNNDNEKEENNENNEDENKKDEDNTDSEYVYTPVKYTDIDINFDNIDMIEGACLNDDIVILKLVDEVQKAESNHYFELEKDYGDDFFKENSLMLVSFEYCSSESLIEFAGVIVRESKLYPIFAVEVNMENDLSTDLNDLIVAIEVKNDDISDLSVGEILAVNTLNPEWGSKYYESLNLKFPNK